MEYENFRSIAEVDADHNTGNITTEISAYIEKGWTLLAIHQRGYDYTKQGESARTYTVYILGHFNRDAVKPKYVYETRKWE